MEQQHAGENRLVLYLQHTWLAALAARQSARLAPSRGAHDTTTALRKKPDTHRLLQSARNGSLLSLPVSVPVQAGRVCERRWDAAAFQDCRRDGSKLTPRAWRLQPCTPQIPHRQHVPYACLHQCEACKGVCCRSCCCTDSAADAAAATGLVCRECAGMHASSWFESDTTMQPASHRQLGTPCSVDEAACCTSGSVQRACRAAALVASSCAPGGGGGGAGLFGGATDAAAGL